METFPWIYMAGSCQTPAILSEGGFFLQFLYHISNQILSRLTLTQGNAIAMKILWLPLYNEAVKQVCKILTSIYMCPFKFELHIGEQYPLSMWLMTDTE